jgi:hypothetical protein
MKLPTTRRGCIDEYERRRETDTPLTKFDMYIGGMICCSDAEFLYRKPTSSGRAICGFPCMCIRAEAICKLECPQETEKTLLLPWDAPLYEHVGQGD